MSVGPWDIQNPNPGRGSDLPATCSSVRRNSLPPMQNHGYAGCTVYVYGKSGFFLNISVRPLDIRNPNMGRGSDLPATGSNKTAEPLVRAYDILQIHH